MCQGEAGLHTGQSRGKNELLKKVFKIRVNPRLKENYK